MSHYDYIEKCDQDQLIRLVELANEKLKKIRESGWVELWCVGDDCINLAFSQDYAHACTRLIQIAETNVKRGIEVELQLRQVRMRPDEAAEALRELP